MKMLLTLFAAAGLVVVLVSPAYAYHCPRDMKAIDEALAAGAQLNAEDMAKVLKLRKEGEATHKDGSHAASVRVLGEAMKMLGLK